MSKSALPAIRIAIREYKLYINQAALASLKNPIYLQFLYEDERKLLAIAGSTEKKKNSFKIPDRVYRETGDECCVSRMALTEAFRLRLKWDKCENYRVIGEFSPNIDMVVFDLTKAVVVNRCEADNS